MISENFNKKKESGPFDLAKKIIKEKLNCEVTNFSIINTGYGGQVYKLETNSLNEKEKILVLKFSELSEEPTFEEINNNDRIYGNRLSNLLPAYNLLINSNVPVAEIFDSGTTKLNGTRQQYAILKYLPGVSVREFLTESEDPSVDDLHKVTGEIFGRIHNIRRRYQGWVEMKDSQSTDWKESFFDWMNSYLDKIKEGNIFDIKKITAIEQYIKNKRQIWTNPSEFVLSHMDGFQGMAQRIDTNWKITGVIDIEDHQFMDQRHVLAGHEVVLRLEGKKLPEAFWDEYKNNTDLDASYQELKDLFMLSYLLAWRNIFQGYWHGKQEERESSIEKNSKLIDEIVKIK